MGSEEAADKAVSSLDNKVMNGRPMKVSFDRGKTGGVRRRQQQCDRETPLMRGADATGGSKAHGWLHICPNSTK